MGNYSSQTKRRKVEKDEPSPSPANYPAYSSDLLSSTSSEIEECRTETEPSPHLLGLPEDRNYYCIWYRHSGQPDLDDFPESASFKQVREADIAEEKEQHHITHAIIKGNLPRLKLIAPKLNHLRIDKLTNPQQLQCLPSLSDLKELILDGNDFSAGLPNVVEMLTSIETIRLSKCRLKDLPQSFSKLTRLHNLDLSWNDFSAGLPSVLTELASLETIRLNYCELRELPPSVSTLSQLKELDLSFNDYSQGLPDVIKELLNLEILKLTCCKLTDLPACLSSLTLLKEIDLSRNDFNAAFPAVVKDLSDLETLNLSQCKLKDLPKRFVSETSLRTLDLSYNGFVHLPSAVYNMDHLQELNLTANHNLMEIDKAVLQLQKLDNLNCVDCHALLSPPYEVCNQSLSAIRKFLTDLQGEKGLNLLEMCVSVVGMQRSGKSSLIHSLVTGKRKLTVRKDDTELDEATKVFQLKSLKLPNSRLKLIDHAGHEVYHMAYQLVINDRCIPVIVVNMAEFKSLALSNGSEEATRRVCFDWLSHLYLACPRLDSPLLILTHTDRLSSEEREACRRDLLKMSEILRERMLEEKQRFVNENSFQPTSIPHLEDFRYPLFDRKDIFEFNNDLNEKANIESLSQCLDDRCQKWKTEIPRLWERVEEFIDGQVKNPYIDLKEIIKKFPSDEPRTILRYMHGTGKILWYEDLDELSTYVFHQITAITEMVSLLFHHASDEEWKKRVENFKPFFHKEKQIGKHKYEEFVKNFNAKGVIDEILLFHLLKTDSRFPPHIATALLRSFRILHGPIEEVEGSRCYILPYFSKCYMNNSWKKNDRVPLRLDIVFGGLSLPQYVYQLTTVVVLNCTKSQLTDEIVMKNGAVIHHGDCTTYLIHDHNNRKLTLQVSTTVQQLHVSWKHLIKTAKTILKLIKGVWEASSFEVLVYCAQCLLSDNSKPSYHTDPRWFYPIDGDFDSCNLINVTSISKLERVACQRCGDGGQNRPSVPMPLRFPCEQLFDQDINDLECHIHAVKSHSNQLQGEAIENTSRRSNSKLEGSDLSDVEDAKYCDEKSAVHLSLKLKIVRDKGIKGLYRNTDKVYPMTDSVRGRVLIINVSEFTGAQNRVGSDVDYHHLQQLFTDLRFEVSKTTEYKVSFTAQEIREAISTEASNEDHYKYGMFVLALMSHGREGDVILDSQCQSVSLASLQDLLSPRNFPAMKGKPKLIIVQACSGERHDFGEIRDVVPVPITRANQPSTSSAEFNKRAVLAGTSELGIFIKSSDADEGPCSVTEDTCLNSDDFLILKASSESYTATRSLTHGSWFIRILVATFYRHSCHRDVESLFKIIQKRVRKVSLTHQSANTPALNGNMPTSKCTFTNYRKLYLFPGYPPLRHYLV